MKLSTPRRLGAAIATAALSVGFMIVGADVADAKPKPPPPSTAPAQVSQPTITIERDPGPGKPGKSGGGIVTQALEAPSSDFMACPPLYSTNCKVVYRVDKGIFFSTFTAMSSTGQILVAPTTGPYDCPYERCQVTQTGVAINCYPWEWQVTGYNPTILSTATVFR